MAKFEPLEDASAWMRLREQWLHPPDPDVFVVNSLTALE